MGIIGRREFLLVMKMDDETKKEREALNRGLGETQRSSKKAADEAKRSIVDVAKASKANVEGLKSVLELGGWLMLAREVGKAFMDITKEARANSTAFKEAGGALAVVKREMGAGLVKALEPLATGFKDILLVGTAVFKNFPEVAKAAFDYIKAIINKTLSWEGMNHLILAWGEGVVAVFKAAFEYIPKLFVQMVQLLLTPIYRLGEYVADTLGKAFTLKFDDIEKPGEFVGRIMDEQGTKLAEIAAGAKDFIANSAGAIKTAAVGMASTFAPETKAFADKLAGILGPTLDKLKLDTAAEAAKEAPGSAAGSPFGGLMDEWTARLVQQSGDKLAILDMERAAALEKLREGLTDTEELRRATVLVNEYYDKATLAAQEDAARAATEAAERAANEQIKVAQEAAAAAQKAAQETREANLAGKNGLGAALGETFAGSEMAGGGLAAGLGPLIAMVAEFAGSLENVGAVMNPITTIMKAAFEVLGPVVNNLLAPLVGILKIVGYTLGKLLVPVLELLRPIITLVAEAFVFVYNKVVVPIFNGIMTVFNLIYNGFAAFINGILWLVDQIPFVDVGRVAYRDLAAGHLAEIGVDGLAAAGTATGGSGGSSASYAAGTSIRIEKLEIRAEVIAGDRGIDEVALMFRDRILELERQGR